MQAAMTPITTPTTARWTRDDYYRLLDAGILTGRRVQLLDGEIIEMPAMKAPHARALIAARTVLLTRRPDGGELAQQTPTSLGLASDPEPDAMIYRLDDRHPVTGHPSQPLWVMEISDTTLRFDLGVKLRIYARAGIAAYWVLDLNGRVLHVHAEPTGGRYAHHQVYQPGDVVALPWPASPVSVADLLA